MRLNLASYIYVDKNKIKNINKEGIISIGRNKISIECMSAVTVNNNMLNPLLTTHKYKALIPILSVTHKSLVRDEPIDWSMQAFTVLCSF